MKNFTLCGGVDQPRCLPGKKFKKKLKKIHSLWRGGSTSLFTRLVLAFPPLGKGNFLKNLKKVPTLWLYIMAVLEADLSEILPGAEWR